MTIRTGDRKMKIIMGLERGDHNENPRVEVLDVDRNSLENTIIVEWKKETANTPVDVRFVDNTIYVATKEGLTAIPEGELEVKRRWSVDWKNMRPHKHAKGEGALAVVPQGSNHLLAWGLRTWRKNGDQREVKYHGLQLVSPDKKEKVLGRSVYLERVAPESDIIAVGDDIVYASGRRIISTTAFGRGFQKGAGNIHVSKELPGEVQVMTKTNDDQNILAVCQRGEGLEQVLLTLTPALDVIGNKPLHFDGDYVTAMSIFSASFALPDRQEQEYHPQPGTQYVVVGTELGKLALYEFNGENIGTQLINGYLHDEKVAIRGEQVRQIKVDALPGEETKKVYLTMGKRLVTVDVFKLLQLYDRKHLLRDALRSDVPDRIESGVQIYERAQEIARFDFMR